jgi:hypothetical protein
MSGFFFKKRKLCSKLPLGDVHERSPAKQGCKLNKMHNTVSLPFVYVDVSHKKANTVTNHEAGGNV